MSEISSSGVLRIQFDNTGEEVSLNLSHYDWEAAYSEPRSMGAETCYVMRETLYSESGESTTVEIELYEYPQGAFNDCLVSTPSGITVLEEPDFYINPSDRRYEDEVEEEIQKSGLSFTKEASVNGAVIDYVIDAPDGKIIALELKDLPDWDIDSPNQESNWISQAQSQVDGYRERLNASDVYIVLAGLPESLPEKGLFSPKDLRSNLTEQAAKSETPASDKKDYERLVFVAMPFDPKYEDTYFHGIVGAAKEAKVATACKRIDKKFPVGEIPKEIKSCIRKSDLVVVDLSDSNPNVLYEMGYAEALEKPTIRISSTPLGELPFNVRNQATLPYDIGRTHSLKKDLIDKLDAV